MTYAINPTKTSLGNMAGLLSDKSVQPIAETDIDSISPPTVITPAAGNGNNNTQVTVTGAAAGNHPGTTTVQYTRLKLSDNRTKAGTRIFCVNGDTHLTIHQKIIDHFKFVADQYVIIDPVRVPVAGETLQYIVVPNNNGLVYTTDSFTIDVMNVSKDIAWPVHPSYFFGAPATVYNGKNIYKIPTTSYKLFVNPDLNTASNFLRLLNMKKNVAAPALTASQIGLGAPSDVSLGYTRNLVAFTVGDGTRLSEDGYIEHVRPNKLDEMTTGSLFDWSGQVSMTITSAHQYYSYFHNTPDSGLLSLFMKLFSISSDAFAFNALTNDGTNRRLFIILNGTTYAGWTTPKVNQYIFTPYQGGNSPGTAGNTGFGTSFQIAV